MMNMSNIMRLKRFTQSPIGFLTIRSLHKDHTEVSWMKPGNGWTKLNFDGSCKGSGNSSIGGVLRDHNAEFLFGYAEPIGKSTSVAAEMAALRRGLELVLESGLDHIWLEGDSKILIQIIRNHRLVKCLQTQKHVRDIKLMIPEFRNCILSHVFREGNRVADKFAKMGYRSNKLEIWREVPPKMGYRPTMHDDAEGKVLLRRR